MILVLEYLLTLVSSLCVYYIGGTTDLMLIIMFRSTEVALLLKVFLSILYVNCIKTSYVWIDLLVVMLFTLLSLASILVYFGQVFFVYFKKLFSFQGN